MKAFIGLLVLCGAYSTKSASVGVPQVLPCADQDDGTLLPVLGECSRFYICLNGMAIPSDCGVQLHYDPVRQACIEQSSSSCVPGQLIQIEPYPEIVPETPILPVPQTPIIVESTICTGKAIGAFVPSKISCSDYYVCLGSKPMLKSCKEGLHFNSESGSCIPAEVSTCFVKPQPAVEKNKQKKQKPSHKITPQETVVFAETVCRGQANGAMFAAPGSCTKYYACLQNRAFEQSCGARHFDPSVRTCVEVSASKCVEGAVAMSFEAEPAAEIGNTNFGEANDGVFIGNANLDLTNDGFVSNLNLVSGSSNLIVGNTQVGNENYINVASGQSSQAKPEFSAIQAQNSSIGNSQLGQNNSGIFIGNANIALNNTGSVSNANIVLGSKDVQVGNSNLGSSNAYTIVGGNLVGNGKVIPIKHTGLPIHKKPGAFVEKLDISVSSSGIVVDANDQSNTKDVDIGDTNLGSANAGIFIGNANLNLNNTGTLSDVNIVSGSSNVLVGNTKVGANNSINAQGAQAVAQAEVEKENKAIVYAVMDEDSAEACEGIASGTLLPRAGNCRQFLTCESGLAFVGECPRDLHFNAKMKFCDWPELAGCA